MGVGGSTRGVTSVVGVVMVVALTIILASVVGVYAFGFSEDATETPNFAALELEFEEEAASAPSYDEFLWLVRLTHTGGEVVDGEEIVVHLDHGDQRVTGELEGSLTAGETVALAVIHNNQDGGNFPEGYGDDDEDDCETVNIACRLAGDEENYPEEDRVQLRMIHRPSGTILYEETIGISGNYGIFNGNPESGVDITDETLTFA